MEHFNNQCLRNELLLCFVINGKVRFGLQSFGHHTF